MSVRSRGAGKRGEMAARAGAELLRDAYLIALGRQALRNANSHRNANVGPYATTAKHRGRAR